VRGRTAGPAVLAGITGIAAAVALTAAALLQGRPRKPAIPAEPVTLLLLEGRATQPGPEPDVRLALDGAGGVLRIDSRLRVTRVPLQLGGRQAASVASAAGGSLWLTDAAGDLIRTDPRGRLIAAAPSSFAYPTVAAGRTSAEPWLVRSAERFSYDARVAQAPLLLRVGGAGAGDAMPVGQAVLPAHFLLADLANAGHLAVGEGVVYYAPFIRDEVVALAPAGDTLWLTRRGLPQSTTEPRFEMKDRRVVVDYHPVNLGLTLGAEGRLYVLSTPGFTTAESRLDVLDPSDGRLLVTTHLPTARPTIAVDRAGQIHLLDAARLLDGVPERDREPAPELDLPAMGGGRFTSRSLLGRVALLNFWASWCAPCRSELPALDSLRRELADSEFAFVGINEEEDTGAARAFMDQFGFTFPVAFGQGRLRPLFHFPGLPYTVLLDRGGRIAGRWIGYAGPEQIQAMRALIRSELSRGDGHGHRHGG
jgi:thiol-disulfide isomerase/thioredoxin